MCARVCSCVHVDYQVQKITLLLHFLRGTGSGTVSYNTTSTCAQQTYASCPAVQHGWLWWVQAAEQNRVKTESQAVQHCPVKLQRGVVEKHLRPGCATLQLSTKLKHHEGGGARNHSAPLLVVQTALWQRYFL